MTSSSPDAGADRPLDGVRVLELAEGIAGPYTGKWLAALGADVIKIERPTGDPSRAAGPWPDDLPNDEASGLYLYLNANKRGITLNLDTSDGRELLKELVKTADILTESFTPGYLAERALGWEDLKSLRPELVMLSVTPYGQTGPHADLPATELTVYAMAAQLWLTGHPAKAPLKNGGSQPSYQAGLNAFAAVTGAYYGALISGQGSHVDVSMQETYAGMAEAFMPRASQLKTETMRSGNNLNAVWGLYPLADGWGGVCCLPRNYPGLANATGIPELHEDRFADPAQRLENNDELMAILYGWFAGLSRDEIVPLGIQHRVPIGFVATVEDLSNSDHLNERRFFAEDDHPHAGRIKYPGRIWLSDRHDWKAGRAPELGEHNVDVLHGELGYDKTDLVRLRELDAI